MAAALHAVARRTAVVVQLVRLHRELERWIQPRLFHRIRLGYAVWHTLAVAGRPLTAEEVYSALVRGTVLTTAARFGLGNVQRALAYHARVGKLRRRGDAHYTIA